MLEEKYPYTSGTSKKKGSCQYDASEATNVSVKSFSYVTKNNSEQMKAALDQGVLAVAIEADKRVFQTYKSGVLSSSECGTKLDHAVTAVGYGVEDGQEYFLIKNSWNTTWGDQGYVKLAMNSTTGTCGVQEDPMLPIANN